MRQGPGVYSSLPQRFVNIDVAQAGQNALVKKQGLDLPAMASQQLPQRLRREGVGERLGTQVPQEWDLARIIDQVDAAKLARIAETQRLPRHKPNHHPCVRPPVCTCDVVRLMSLIEQQTPGHAQMHHQQLGRCQADDGELAAPGHPRHVAPDDPSRELGW